MAAIVEPTECPYYLISRASLVITAELKKALAAVGAGHVRVSYLGVLMVLWSQQEDCKAGDLGRRAGLEPSTMTGVLDRMERDGLVARHPDPNDRRAQRIRLTDAGREIQTPILEAVDTTLARVMNGIEAGEADHLKDTLRRVLSNSDKMSGP